MLQQVSTDAPVTQGPLLRLAPSWPRAARTLFSFFLATGLPEHALPPCQAHLPSRRLRGTGTGGGAAVSLTLYPSYPLVSFLPRPPFPLSGLQAGG